MILNLVYPLPQAIPSSSWALAGAQALRSSPFKHSEFEKMTIDSNSSYNEKYFDGNRPHALHNKNVEWLRYQYVWWIYGGLILFVINLLRMLLIGTKYDSLGAILTITHITHNLIFFYIFHWQKGSPDNFSQGEFNGLTVWEQIDDGIPWTKTKKTFFLVHTALIFAASYASNYDYNLLAINGPVYVVLGILPKIPEMHRVRLFGINSTIGIDDVDSSNGHGPPINGFAAAAKAKRR